MENLSGLIEKLFNEFADEHEDFAFDPESEELVKDAMALAFKAGQNTFDPDFDPQNVVDKLHRTLDQMEADGEPIVEDGADEVSDAETPKVKYPQVMVELTGQDGNAFNLIGIVARKLQQRIDLAAADAFRVEAMNQGSYDELLAFIQRTVDVR